MELTSDPDVLLNFVCGTTTRKGIIGNLRSMLVHQGGRADETARSLGYVNSEHWALAFIVEPLFRHLVNAILASRCVADNSPVKYATWLGFAQALLDQRYEGKVTMDPEEEIIGAPPVLRRDGPKPRNCLEYLPVGGNGRGSMTVLEILDLYNQVIEQEQWHGRLPKEYAESYVRDVGDDRAPIRTA